MANIVVKKLGSRTGGRMFEFTDHADELGLVAGRTDHAWEVWLQGPERPIDTSYEVVFAATNKNDHDRLNFRKRLRLGKKQKSERRLDKTLRRAFGIPGKLEFIKAQVLISLVPALRRVVLVVRDMQWR